jgi:Winged helix DNA-binding domain
MRAEVMRAWWWHRQGLDGALAGADPATVLAATGWARSVGGAGPYLSLFARSGSGRAQVDAAVADLAVGELPAARGCTYVVPAADFGLALQVGRHAPEAEAAVAGRLGVTRAELDALCSKVADALASGPLDPAGLKDVLGPAVRNLGAEGRKKGLSTTLPVALGLLQAAGEIRRVPVNGRLDQQRYAYARWSPVPTGLSEPEARAELARRYFRWTGGASLAELRWFTAFSARHAKAAVAGLGLVDVGEGRLALPEDAAELAAFVPAARPRYALLAGNDALLLLRRDVPGLLDAADLGRPVPGHRSGACLGDLADLPGHAIVDRGRLIGLWEYDVDAERIAWWVFDAAALADSGLHAAVERTQAHVRDQIGDARGFSLDSPKSRAGRIGALRAAVSATP